MKILCVIDSLGSGGAQNQLVKLAKGFHENGHEVSFLTYHNLDFFKEELIKNNITVHCIEDPSYLKRVWKMRTFIRSGRYDAVLSFLETPNFICEIAGLPFRKWKLIVGERSANPNIEKSFKLKSYRWFHFLADFVVSNSNTNRDIVKRVNRLIPLEKLKVIYNLVDTGSYKTIKRSTSQNRLVLLIAASHQKLKNLNGLIEAVNLLTETEKSKLRIHWYGDEADSSFNNAKNKIQKYSLEDNFVFYKATRDIKNRMLEADIIGLFSFYEGFPNTICEAMSLAKPVICSSVSDIPDARYLFNPNNTDEIAKVLSNVLKLNDIELEAIGNVNKGIANTLFDKGLIISQYLSLMQQK
jgi:glycosyltransferase involved in cell wall biosynthesis